MYSRVFADVNKIPSDPTEAAIYFFNRGLQVVPFRIYQEDNGKYIKIPTLKWKETPYKHDDKTKSIVEKQVNRYGAFGIVVPKNICVIDLDRYPSGLNNLLSLAEEAPETSETFDFIDTLTVVTPKGGIHLYYMMQSNRSVTSVSKLAPNIDVRGSQNSCIIVPPSKIPGYDEPYMFENSRAERKIPTWIYQAMTKKVERPEWAKKKINENAKSWAARFLNNSCMEVANAISGTRNDTLNKYAFSCYKFLVKENLIPEEEVEVALISAGMDAGLSLSEVEKTLLSARNAVHI